MSEEAKSGLSWEQDYAVRTNPGLLSRLLHESVPLCEWAGWRMTEVREGFARSELPLQRSTTNQHGTIQASLLVLAGDYTGGVALGSVIRGVGAVGVHPRDATGGMLLWLTGVDIKYRGPCTSPVVIESSLPPDSWDRIRRRYRAGQTVMMRMAVQFRTPEGEIVADGEFGYSMRMAMPPDGIDADSSNALAAHKSAASARLIAGIRATIDPQIGSPGMGAWCAEVAGPHGRLLASRFTEAVPDLVPVVAARTADVEAVVRHALDQGVAQLVFLGVGLDVRMFGLPRTATDSVRVFEIDRRPMLEERQKAVSRICDLPAIDRRLIAIDLRRDSLASEIIAAGFDPNRGALIIMEGVSMYQSERDFRAILNSVASLLTHPGSLLWIDTVSEAVVTGESGDVVATRFVDAMRKIGEPFSFGHDEPEAIFAQCGLSPVRSVKARQYIPHIPVLDHYVFWALQRASQESA